MTQSSGFDSRRGVPAPLAHAQPEPPLKEVLVELWQNTETLVRQEITLARTELDAKTRKFKGELTAAAIAGGLMLCGVLALVAAVILLLALVVPAWAAALIVGAAATGGGFALFEAKKPSVQDLVPERTIQNIEQDARALREATK